MLITYNFYLGYLFVGIKKNNNKYGKYFFTTIFTQNSSIPNTNIKLNTKPVMYVHYFSYLLLEITKNQSYNKID